MNSEIKKGNRWLVMWLMAGVIMVFVQILVGGVTRLTGSGLSITRWDIVTGTIPPLNDTEWNQAFDLYKETPQYKQINQGMDLGEFKYIFFWEYFHRLWARSMGFVFLMPFLLFLWFKLIGKDTLRRLGVVVLIAALAATFGWIMVASGLINRPWVNAYKLTVHLSLGISLFIFLWYTWLVERGISYFPVSSGWKRAIRVLIALAIVQICFGGFVSGMKSALNYPTWPLMHGEYIPQLIFDSAHWTKDSLLLYDQSGFMPALVQVIHRNLGYIIFFYCIVFAVKWIRTQQRDLHWLGWLLVGIIVVQVLLGILTLLGSKGSIPVFYGVLHQGIGILFLTTLIYINIRSKLT
jgi:cytochrome c oxidase assembly protein subunit 15